MLLCPVASETRTHQKNYIITCMSKNMQATLNCLRCEWVCDCGGVIKLMSCLRWVLPHSVPRITSNTEQDKALTVWKSIIFSVCSQTPDLNTGGKGRGLWAWGRFSLHVNSISVSCLAYIQWRLCAVYDLFRSCDVLFNTEIRKLWWL